MDEDLDSPEILDDRPSRLSKRSPTSILPNEKAKKSRISHNTHLLRGEGTGSKSYLGPVSGLLSGTSVKHSEQEPTSSFLSKGNSFPLAGKSPLQHSLKGFSPSLSKADSSLPDLETIIDPLDEGEFINHILKNESDKIVFKCSPPQSLRSKVKQDWTYGSVSGPRLEHSFYVKPVSPLPPIFDPRKDVYVKNEIVPGFHHLLELSQGDMIQFKLHPPKHRKPIDNKPSARGATILCYCAPRTYHDLKLFLDRCTDQLDNCETRADLLTSILSSEAFWLYLFNATSDNANCDEKYHLNILDFVFALTDHMSNFPVRRNEIFSMILQKNIIGKIKDVSQRQEYEFLFIKCAVTVDPTLLKDVIPWINRIMENAPASFTGVLHKILMKLADVVDLSNWKVLTEIPSVKEMLGDPLERVSYLRPISLNSGYKDGDDYLNVYYRLLRAECFSAVQKGIVDFRRKRLDPRDMDIYDKVAVVDIDIDHTTILLSLQFRPYRPVNWSRSKKLMFGNLLCLTVEGDFSDPIWLTVSERDVMILQKRNVIGTELISFQNSDTNSARIIQRMLSNSGRMIMAESPTYFKSFQHVLSSLKDCQLEDFHLYREIVHGVHS